MAKIQDNNTLYNILNRYARLFFPSAYCRIERHGLENIPDDAAIIYAPNHTNALMDALTVLFLDKKPKVFVARADMFKNPTFARILTFLKIMPVMRIRDGYENLKKNEEIIAKAVDVLCSGTPFCILPEGTHRTMHSLLPLSKGIFRIALQAENMLPENKPLYIVPVGIEYGNFFRYRSSLMINVGTPINVRDFKKDFFATCPGATDAELVNRMKEELTARMKSLITWIPDDERYESLRVYCAMHNKSGKSLLERMKRNQEAISRYLEMQEKEPEKAAEILAEADKVKGTLKTRKISLSSVVKRSRCSDIIMRTLVSALTSPVALTGFVLNSPILALSRYVYKKMDDDAFYNSLRFILTAALSPILFLIYFAVCLAILSENGILSYMTAIISALILMSAGKIHTWWFRFSRRLVSDIRYRML